MVIGCSLETDPETVHLERLYIFFRFDKSCSFLSRV